MELLIKQKHEILKALEIQQEQSNFLIVNAMQRNEFLKRQLSEHEQVEPAEFPPVPNPPPNDLVEQYFDARRNFFSCRRKHRLLEISAKLNERLSAAQNILKHEIGERAKFAVSMFSPTVARLSNINQNNQNSSNQMPTPNKSQMIEISLLDEQLNAIEELKKGTKPRQLGKIKYDFVGKIKDIENSISEYQNRNNDLMNEIVNNINNLIQNDKELDKEINMRQKDMSSFQKFASTYYHSVNEVEKLKYTKLLQLMKDLTKETQKERFQNLYDHLYSEKQMIDQQLSIRGNGDFNTHLLKSEIEFQTLYLGHLAAVAGKALSRISTENEPIDPVEAMQADIIRMEHLLRE